MIQKRQSIVFTLIAVAVLAGLAYWFVSQKSNSITDLDDVVRYIEPEAYYVTDTYHKLTTSPAGQGKVILPREFDVGEFGRKIVFNREDGFVGPDACKECHADQFSTFIETAHYQTSAMPTENNISGSVADGENTLKTRADALSYCISEDDSKYLQTALFHRDGKTWEHKEQIDIVTGSGKNGQSYLFWQNDHLYQLPVSWIVDQGWVNSPGYTDGVANFARPVRDNCMSCHSTRMEFADQRVNIADPHSVILGVTCERCHGPGQQHVEFHRQNPDAPSKHIVHPGELPRERLNDICSQCHSGSSQLLKPAFSFRPGEVLSEYRRFTTNGEKPGGVHTANQFPRLRQSKCYENSAEMSCATCHNPHKNERDRPEIFSRRCQTCHQPEDCGQFEESGMKIATNCIDCHMPKKLDSSITFDIEGKDKDQFLEIRDHFIRVQRTATSAVLKKWEQESESK